LVFERNVSPPGGKVGEHERKKTPPQEEQIARREKEGRRGNLIGGDYYPSVGGIIRGLGGKDEKGGKDPLKNRCSKVPGVSEEPLPQHCDKGEEKKIIGIDNPGSSEWCEAAFPKGLV